MACEDVASISCRLDQIVAAMTGFDLNSFASTLLATLLGAGVALLGSWLLFLREQRSQYEARLTSVLVEVVQAGADLAAANEEWRSRPRVIGGEPSVFQRTPSVERFRATLVAATLTAKGTDLEILRALRDTANMAGTRNPQRNIDVVDDVIEVISHWRAPQKDSGFDPLATARRIPLPREYDAEFAERD